MPTRRKPRREEEEFEFEVLPARDVSPREATSLLVAGPPKSGKSKFLSSLAKEYPTLLIATLEREASSWGYQQTNPDTILLEDPGWRPSRGRFEATAYNRFLALTDKLQDDEDYRVVLLDCGTQLGVYAWYESLKAFGVASPADMEDKDNRFRPYTKIADLMRQAIDGLVALKFAKVPKHVIISWHLQPAKDDTIAFDKAAQSHVKKLSADTRGAGSEYLGDYLPEMPGGFRRKIAGLVDGVVFTDVLFERPPRESRGRDKRPRYVLQVVADEERMASLPGPLSEEKYIDNDWEYLKPLLGVESYEEE